jgi:flagellar basal body-associated protein FliL
MAEQNQSSEREPQGGDAKPAGVKKGKLALIGLIGGVMVAEAIAIFVATRFLGGPAKAEATVPGLEAGEHGEGAKPAVSDKEVVVASFRAMNDRSGHNVIYDMKVYGRVSGASADKVQKLFEDKKASIEDRLAKVIRAADPQYFKEPGLETLRRQIKHEVDAALGDANSVQEILIPSLMWYSADS